jgi:serine/threonine protein kinase
VRAALPQRIMGVKYSFPSNLHLSRECVDLISKIFQANPSNRISIAGIRAHPWFLKNLPEELRDGGAAAQARVPSLSLRIPSPLARTPGSSKTCRRSCVTAARPRRRAFPPSPCAFPPPWRAPLVPQKPAGGAA